MQIITQKASSCGLFFALYFKLWIYLALLYPVASIYGEEGNGMVYEDALSKLEMLGEEHLLSRWQDLNPKQQQHLLQEIEMLHPHTFQAQQAVLQAQQAVLKTPLETNAEKSLPLEAFSDYAYKGSENNLSVGRKLLAEGKVGVLLVAGGQGTRLSFDGPKGTFPISVVAGKTLFQLFAEKVVAASKCYGRLLPLAIMTSPHNHAATVAFFQQHGNFGLDPQQLFFCTQTELPFLDDQGHLMLLDEFSIAQGPDGNGSSLKAFVQAGIWEAWSKAGVEFLNFILVDNPLADPFDAELIGFHATEHAAITLKCVSKNLPEERVGVVVSTEKGPRIIEYSEMEENELKALSSDGLLKHRCANISLFCFDMDFIKQSSRCALPWHLAYKAITVGGSKGWKFETFIFDVMAQTNRIKVLLYPRLECFAPLKNEKGEDSIQTVQSALLQRDVALMEHILGRAITHDTFELAQEFYYPTEGLLNQWKDYSGPFQGYIAP